MTDETLLRLIRVCASQGTGVQLTADEVLQLNGLLRLPNAPAPINPRECGCGQAEQGTHCRCLVQEES